MTKGKGECDRGLPRSILKFLYEKKKYKTDEAETTVSFDYWFFVVVVVEYLEFHLFIEQL